MVFFPAENANYRILRHVIHAIAELDDLIVLHDRAFFGGDDAFDDGDEKLACVQAPLVIAVCAISSLAWVRESDRFNARLIDAAKASEPVFRA